MDPLDPENLKQFESVIMLLIIFGIICVAEFCYAYTNKDSEDK